MIWDLLLSLSVPVGRSVLGWAENAFEDGKVSRYEVTMLGATILRVGFVGIATSWGFQVDLPEATAIAGVLDYYGTWASSALKAVMHKAP